MTYPQYPGVDVSMLKKNVSEGRAAFYGIGLSYWDAQGGYHEMSDREWFYNNMDVYRDLYGSDNPLGLAVQPPITSSPLEVFSEDSAEQQEQDSQLKSLLTWLAEALSAFSAVIRQKL